MLKQTKVIFYMPKQEIEKVEIQLCPVCGNTPMWEEKEAARTFRGDGGVIDYRHAKYNVVCHNCGLTAKLEYWNKLKYEKENDDEQ